MEKMVPFGIVERVYHSRHVPMCSVSLFKNAADRLEAYDAAYDLVRQVYRVTESFPDSERYGLVSQARRSATSVASNLAEGAGRHTRGQFLQFVRVSLGSLSELKLHLKLSADLNLLSESDALTLSGLCDTVGRRLWGLHQYLRKD